MTAYEMRESALGKFVSKFYTRLLFKRKWLALVTRREGGQMRSVTLRRVLKRHHDVEVGHHSYGSLLEPGECDPRTKIGAYVSIGPGVRRFGAAHPLDALSLHPYWYNPALGLVDSAHDVERTTCTIGNDVWIGADAIILPGCSSIGTGAVIGAGSVVTKDVEPYSVVVGSPAKVIQVRLSEDARQQLLTSEYWTKPPIEAREHLDAISGKLSKPNTA